MHNEAEVSAELRHRLSNVLQLLTTLGRMRLSRTQDAEARRQVGWLLCLLEWLALALGWRSAPR